MLIIKYGDYLIDEVKKFKTKAWMKNQLMKEFNYKLLRIHVIIKMMTCIHSKPKPIKSQNPI